MAKAGVLASTNCASKSKIFERTKDVSGLPNERRFDRGRHGLRKWIIDYRNKEISEKETNESMGSEQNKNESNGAWQNDD
jgi:hypothetical protein